MGCLVAIVLAVIVLLVVGAIAFQAAGWAGIAVVFVLLVVGGGIVVLVWGVLARRRLFAELAEESRAMTGATLTVLRIAELDGPPASALVPEEDDFGDEPLSADEAAELAQEQAGLRADLADLRWVAVEVEVVPPVGTDGWAPDAIGMIVDRRDGASSATPIGEDYKLYVDLDDLCLVEDVRVWRDDRYRDDFAASVTGPQRISLAVGLSHASVPEAQRLAVTYHLIGNLGTIEIPPPPH
jgi:hypothetical protein